MLEQKMSYQERKEKEIEKFPYTDIEQLATRSIERQAEAIREALKECLGYFKPKMMEFAVDSYIDNCLLEHGYIEPKTEDDDR